MKRVLFLAGLLAGVALAQTPIHFRDATGNVDVVYSSGRASLAPTYTFDVRYPGSKVHATIRDEGLEFFADRVQGAALQDKNGKVLGLARATASGGVRVVKSTQGKRSEISGPSARYVRTGGTATLTMSGPVRLAGYSSTTNENVQASGSSLKATLAAGKSAEPLKSATLLGPVVIDATHRVSAGKLGKVHATGGRLDLDYSSRPAKLTMSGGVHVKGDFGEMSGVSKVVMTLNEKGEVASIETLAGGGR